MAFWKKKKMIDIREMQRQGKLRITKPGHEPSQNAEGFVELGKESNPSSNIPSQSTTNTTENGGFFSFMDNPASSSPVDTSPGSSPEISSTLRKISQQMSDLDNKLYKLEQRIELLERKAGVGNL